MRLSPDGKGMTVITTLDVCHSDGGVIATWDMPGILEHACSAFYIPAPKIFFTPSIRALALLFDFRDERPPRG
jgi:hypothetical protein